MSDGLAAGITDLGHFSPVTGPYLGGGDTAQAQAADGQAILQWQVCTYNAAGRLVPFSTSGDYASGAVTFGANPANSNTLTIAGAAITFVTSGATGQQVNIGLDTTATAQATKALINANPALYKVTAAGLANVLTLTAIEIGTNGNAVTLAASALQPTVSGATLTGGTATEDTPTGDAAAIAAQAVPAATPGMMLPIFVSGRFDANGIVWPPGIATIDQKRLALAGKPIFVVVVL